MMVHFLTDNWWWILLAAGLVVLQARGHAGHGRGGCCGAAPTGGLSDVERPIPRVSPPRQE